MSLHISIATLVVLLVVTIPPVSGHGRLIDPVSRSTMWRYGYSNPANYNDNQLYCGGYVNQYYNNDGKCGVCGDPYEGPRHNEAGGKYANGIIVAKYALESEITVKVQITANHLGWIEFNLCPHNNTATPVTQQCLDEYPLRIVGSRKTRKDVGRIVGIVSTTVQLPDGVTCSQCVLQWKYHAGNSWGLTETGEKCMGCGDQEEFYGCADIAILPRGANLHTVKPDMKHLPRGIKLLQPDIKYQAITQPTVDVHSAREGIQIEWMREHILNPNSSLEHLSKKQLQSVLVDIWEKYADKYNQMSVGQLLQVASKFITEKA